MSNLTLLPSSESESLKQKDIAMRGLIVDKSHLVDVDPRTCVATVLPHLASVYRLPYWDLDWNVEVKRALVAEARELHAHAGTPWCLLRILEIMGLSTEEHPAIILEYGNRDQYRVQLRRDGTHRYDGSQKHNGGVYIYDFDYTQWWQFGVVVKVPTSRGYLKYAISLLEMFKPTHTELVGVWYEELPIRDGVRYRYNSVHTHGGTIIRKGA